MAATSLFHSRLSRLFIALVCCAFWLLCVNAQQPPSSSTKEPEGSTIRGRVIYADTGRPLRRAEVMLLGQHGESLNLEEFSDRNGEFTFRNINAGRYLVVVYAPDIVNPFHRVGPRESPVMAIAMGKIEDGFSEVTVDGRTAVKTEIRASRGGVITGRVLSENDEPITKAKITLFHVEKNGKLRPAVVTERPLREQEWMFQTDSRGVYRIAGLPPGEYVVRASESDAGGNPDDAAEGSYTNGSLMVAFHPKALRAHEATSVQVQQGAETEADIRFTDLNSHRISGTVVVDGKAAQFAEVRLTQDRSDTESYAFFADQLRTDSDGRWEIRSVPDGNYILTVSGHGQVRLRDEQHYISVVTQQRELTVDGGDVTDLKIELVEGTRVNGVVSTEGKVQTPHGLFIELTSTASREKGRIKARTYVESNSSFHLTPVSAGSYHFRVTGLGPNHYVKAITLKEKDLLREPMKIEAETSIEGVRVVLSSELVSLSGHVVEKSDRTKSLPNATVLLFPVEPERRRVSDDPLAARTDKDGRFAVKGAPGEYFMFVFDRRRKDLPMEVPTEESLIKNSASLPKIKLEPGIEKRIVELVGP